MRVTRLHYPHPLAVNEEIALSPDHAHHLINVLRHSSGDKVNVFNASDGEFVATLLSAKKSRATAVVAERLRTYSAPNFSIHLCLGISRGDRMDFGIQKSVEMGVTEITPLYSEYSEGKLKQNERLQKKLMHWQRIATSASEQCGRLDVPKINAPKPFTACIGDAGLAPIAVLDASGSSSLTELTCTENVTLLIGAEGGFSEDEITKAKTSECQIVSLGPRIMRTETAPVAAIAILQYRFGDI